MTKIHRSWSIALSACLLSSLAQAQTTATIAANTAETSARTLAFDVATIKPVAPDGRTAHGWVGFQYHSDGVEFSWQSVAELLYFAFGYKTARFDGQIGGLPGWTDSQKYDIVAKMSPTDIDQFQHLNEDQRRQWREQMMQALLVDRFHLVFHRGSKQVPVYELLVAKSGIKMKDTSTDPNPPLGKADDGTPKMGIRWEKDTSIVQGYSMPAWAGFLSSPPTGIGRPVLDETGLAGTYDFTFDWSVYSARIAIRNGVAVPNSIAPSTDATDPGESGSSIFKALDEIGLKLQPSTAPMPTLIIDHIEKPTEN